MKKSPDVALLEGGVLGAPPVGEREPAFPFRLQRGEARLLDRGDLRIVGVAQDEDMELPGGAGRRKPLHHRLDVADDALGVLVAHAPQHRGPGGDRLVAAHAGGHRRHGRDRVGREAHQEQPDGGVPEADHRPGQRDGEHHHQDEVGDAEAAGGQGVGQ